VQSSVDKTARVRQLGAMFDVPLQEVTRLEWKGELPIDGTDWNIGLIVGPSGSGKSTIAKQLFGEHVALDWRSKSVIDDFAKGLSIEQISSVCQSVGFNTIPAWMRPYYVLSTGEKFRVDIARRMLELPDPIVIDEFTSVVDRQVAQIGSHAVQKFVRKGQRKLIAVSCHYDVVEWLQPDWIFEPASMTFQRRLLQRRPPLDATIERVPYAAWSMFSQFHYLTNELHKAARCFVLFVGNRPASFCGVLHRPHAQVDDIKGISRIVTLPDWQGMGLAMFLADTLGAAYKAIGYRLRNYPAHPSFIRAHDKSKNWEMRVKPGVMSSKARGDVRMKTFGGRPCAVFEYCGDAMNVTDARRLVLSDLG
jgi:ABC-type ATPase involved in cell division/GNAT superfamily N-acetyltransferase